MSSLRILVVEDHPPRAAMIADLLQAAFAGEVSVVFASCAAEACEFVKEQKVDALILDPTLPDEWGCEGLVRIRAQESALPVIVAPPTEFEDFAAAALGAGSDGTMREGITATELRGVIEEAVQRRKARSAGAAATLDPETGLRTRAALDALLPEWVNLAVLAGKELLLFHARLHPSETPGAASHSITEAAAVLRETFRHSDVVARGGADDFIAVALVHPGDETDAILAARLDEQLRARAARMPSAGALRLDFSITRLAADVDVERLAAAIDHAVESVERTANGA